MKRGSHTKKNIQNLPRIKACVMQSQVVGKSILGAIVFGNKTIVQNTTILHNKTTTFGNSSITVESRSFFHQIVSRAYVASLPTFCHSTMELKVQFVQGTNFEMKHSLEGDSVNVVPK